jgi:hypothetical protein
MATVRARGPVEWSTRVQIFCMVWQGQQDGGRFSSRSTRRDDSAILPPAATSATAVCQQRPGVWIVGLGLATADQVLRVAVAELRASW